MSHFFNFDETDAATNYHNKRCSIGVDVICGLMGVHCGKPLKDIHILDAGCGTAQYAKALAKLGVGKISLLDCSEEMLRIAEDNLKDEMLENTIHAVVKTELPEMPFEDGSFDAVMFNSVLHHLDPSTDTDTFPVMEQTMRETKRILRPKGIVFILGPLSSMVRETVWVFQLHSGIKEKLAKRFMSIEQYQALFSRCGYRCISALNFLNLKSQAFFPDYWDTEGPLKMKWRKATCIFDVASDGEIKEMEESVKELREKGILEEYAAKNDHSSDRGILTLLVGESV